jgi:hypothetical protein
MSLQQGARPLRCVGSARSRARAGIVLARWANFVRMFTRTAPLLKLFVAIAVILVVIDAVVFRSGWYAPWIEPASTAGSVVNTTLLIDHYYDPARKNVLVLGNSQIGEGFSAALADTLSGRPDLHFINGSVAGTTPRLWNYLLRNVDRHGQRFAAIVLMADYDTSRLKTDFTNYPLDTRYAAPLLRLSDLIDYPDSFADSDLRARARRAIMFPLQALQEDVLDFASHFKKRMRRVETQRPGYIAATAVYPGHPEALPDLPIDKVSRTPSRWDAIDAALKSKLDGYFRALDEPAAAPLQLANDRYQREWIGRISSRYQAHGVPVIVFAVPRGPWHQLLLPAPQPNAALAELRDRGRVQLLPGDTFTELEQPQFFFDNLHMNHAGRERFSALFAQKIAPLVH